MSDDAPKTSATVEPAAKPAETAPVDEAPVAEPVVSPRDRLKALQAKKPHPDAVALPTNVRTESEEIEMRRLAEQIAEEDRLAELRAMKVRTPEQSIELGTLEAREVLR